MCALAILGDVSATVVIVGAMAMGMAIVPMFKAGLAAIKAWWAAGHKL